ncbi:glycoside hydrolase family 17 [Lecanosticta acicola]|uniref:Probable glucan endo-1,3-beta-glucosidase eglC n=1 Tax=Lecanosticta acicola TaxID=111012 RepID=A0AAI8YRN3_9PEZI|nr:glycoside hydrolase family 17 [Lecanosticta acicola]
MLCLTPFLLILLPLAAAQIRGFNSNGIGPNGVKHAADFKREFNRMHNLEGQAPFTSARLYTMIQAGTQSDPVEAFQAALDTKTKLLLGLWASAGDAAFENELAALRKAKQRFGKQWKDVVAGCSVGSEDMYRITPTGIKNKSGAGAGPDVLVRYISKVRQILQGTGTPVGHVDTWTAWVNGSNSAVIPHVDFLGVDAYPYYESDQPDNSISQAPRLFFDAYHKTVAVAHGKPVWVTETGWPVRGPRDFAKAVPSVANAKTYWDEVGCRIFGRINTWWFTLDDTKKDPGEISFSTVGPNLGKPLFDLRCPK